MGHKIITRILVAVFAVALATITTTNVNRVNAAEVAVTKLAFRTQVGAVSIPVGQTRDLGSVDVSPYRQIRVVADERVGSPTNVNIDLIITEGNELVAPLDTLTLTPRSSLTRLFSVPGTKLTILATAVGPGSGSDAIDVLIYGSSE